MKKLYILLFTLLIASLSFGQTTVFINEIHYDNATGTVGGDIDEGIEIAGPAGTDLTNWTIAKYNGNGGTVYGTENLSGTILDQGNGFGTLWFGVPSNGLQNGSPDGMALVAADGTTVIQFLSYEGAITAVGGPADTMTSTDIGVSEPGTTPDGESLQLIGSGTTYENFSWSGPFGHTRGAVNTGQTFGAAIPAINLGADVANLDYFDGFGPSAEGSFSVDGNNLTADILVTAPTDFEVSLTSGGTFTASVIVSQTAGTASDVVYARLAAGFTGPSFFSGDATATSAGATDQIVNLSGTVTPADPQITVTAFLDPLNYVLGSGPSNEDTFTVEGLFLTSDIVVTAPTNFEVSLTTATGFASSVSVPFGTGEVATTPIYVRLAASLAEGPYSGDITVSSTGVTDELVALTGNVFGPPTNALVLTGAYDGPLTGGTPKGIELFALQDIPDLSKFGISSISNGGGSSAGNIEYTFPADAIAAGTHIYLATESTGFSSFFGFAPTYTNSVVGINGDDSIELYENGVIIDTFGDVTMDGSGLAWDYLDGWAYRNGDTGPDGTFVEANWTFSGANALDGETTNATAVTPYPYATYTNILSVNQFDTNSFKVYPNPTSNGFVNITSANNDLLNAKVFDILGKQVIESNVANNQLNVSSLNAGVYILRLTQNNASVTKKLVIQ